MKLNKIFGAICIALAIILICTAVCGHILSAAGDDSTFALKCAKQTQMNAHKTALEKTAPSAVKKAGLAVSAAESAKTDIEKAETEALALIASFEEGKTGNDQLDALLVASPEDENVLNAANALLIENLSSKYNSVYKTLSGVSSKLDTAITGINDVYSAIGIDSPVQSYSVSEKQTFTEPGEFIEGIEALKSEAEALVSYSNELSVTANNALNDAESVVSGDYLTFGEKIIINVGSYPIFFTFTGVLLLALGIILWFFSHKFIALWKKQPLFSTFIALFLLIVIQVYALGFKFESYGEWGLYWLKNMLNVLRAKSSVGMIALGMTFVIITGGIDLAVGSNLAGVATVVMVLLDVSDNGVLTKLGITGTPAYIIAICGGLLTGAMLGWLTGFGVTKGRIPPFIITLGIMQIVRSVAQFFTKSYKPEVPKAFQVLANKEIIGDQMLLPIIYWLVLAALMYVISKHTAFGKQIYAIGSNERASSLSGINVDKVKMKVYTLMGLIVAVAAITSVARLRGVDVASAGSGFEMDAIAAVVVGGTSMSGGRGSIIGTVFGVLMIGIMSNLLVLIGIDAFLSDAFTGAIIIFAVFIQKKDK